MFVVNPFLQHGIFGGKCGPPKPRPCGPSFAGRGRFEGRCVTWEHLMGLEVGSFCVINSGRIDVEFVKCVLFFEVEVLNNIVIVG